jgi:acyl-homoserine lactone synthase
MVHIVNGGNASLYVRELEQAYLLRHRVFVEERGWRCLRKADRREIDQFDSGDAIHIMEITAGQVIGYTRLLPTTRPHLLSDVYPELATRPIPRGAEIFEWTRYCVAPETRGDGAIGNTGSRLLYGVLAYALGEGIKCLTMETDPIWITRFLDFGFGVELLGLPQEFEGELAVALALCLSEEAVHRCRKMLRTKPLERESRGLPLPAVALPAAA